MVVTDANKPERPITLSADHRTISYTSKTGKTLTVKLGNSKNAIDTLCEVSDRSAKPLQEGPSLKKIANQGLWPAVYDAMSFWVLEAVEIATFGPYDEAP